MDLIDAVSAETNMTSIVKLSLSDLFRRKYSSLTDALDSLFRTDLKKEPTREETRKQILKVTQLLTEECIPPQEEQGFLLFATDCTANPRIYADKVCDRTTVHAPNHVPGQKPITVGHEYSVLVHLPNNPIDRELHWVVPLSVRRVESNESGPQVGLSQLEEISQSTVLKNRFCVNVSDAAYSTRGSLIGAVQWPNVVQIARMRSNRKVYRSPPPESKTKRGRPLAYGEEILLSDPSQLDQEEVTTIVTRKGHVYRVLLERWNDVIMQGSKDERTHEHPFDLLRVTVTDKKGKPVYRRPLWVMIAGIKRRDVTSENAYISYGRRYDIEHFFRFGKQRLGLVNSQTCETRHEESWHWIGLLSYNMLYHARRLGQAVAYLWERKRVHVVEPRQRPSQVQRDYGRIIRGIGTPAPVPKPRGKSPGRQLGDKRGERPSQSLIRKSKKDKDPEFESSTKSLPAKKRPRVPRQKKEIQYVRMRRVWAKDRPSRMKKAKKRMRRKKEQLFRIYLN